MQKWASRKLIVTVVGMLGVILVNTGMEPSIAEKVTSALEWLLVTYIGGQSVADAAASLKGKAA